MTLTCLPKFSISLLHPRYWITWIGIGFLWLLVQLPYPVIYRIGYGLGRIALRVMKHRSWIVHRNLELCFPQMDKRERQVMVIKNFESVGMGLMEIGIAWFWSNKRMSRWMELSGIGTDPIKKILSQKHGILLIGIHFMTLEVGARMFGMHIPGIGVYRPNNNPLINWLQTRGRLQSNKSMLDRKNLKGIIRALKDGEIIWYAPDQDYGPKSSVFVPFFKVEQAATTIGTWLLLRSSKAVIVPFVPRRKPNARGYELIVLEPEHSPPINDVTLTAIWMNRIVEKCIMFAPDQYMWLHRRFKTQRNGTPSPY